MTITGSAVEPRDEWVDPHIHLFALDKGRYDWLKPSNPPYWPDKSQIASSRTETQLRLASHNKLGSFVHIEAGFDNERPWREVEFLTQHCTMPFKSVACINVTANSAIQHISKLARYSAVVGARHILDDDAYDILRSPKTRHSLAYLSEQELSFDAQFDVSNAQAVSALLRVVESNPALKVIVNHTAIAPLDMASRAFQNWQQHIQLLSNTGQVAFKFSGLEMQDRNWHWQRANSVFNALVDAASGQNVMFASNYPLSLWRLPYFALWNGFKHMAERYDSALQKAWLTDNANKWYRLQNYASCK